MDTLPLWPSDDNTPVKCCPTCKQSLPATSEFFSRCKGHKDGLQTLCKLCTKEYKKQHYQTHKEEITAKNKVYCETHKEQVSERQRRYAAFHKEHAREYHKQYYEEHKEKQLEECKQRYQANREQIIERVKQYSKLHKEEISEKRKVSWKRRKEQISAKRRRLYQENREHYASQNRHYYASHKQEHKERNMQYRKTERGRLARRASWHRREARKKASCGSYTAQQIEQKVIAQKHKCYYCRIKLSKGTWHIEHIVPVSRGGSNSIDNIVIACPTCNMRKSTKLPHEWPEGGRLL